MILVTGGSGFIGTRFCQRIIHHDVNFRILDLVKGIEFPERTICGDVMDMESLIPAMKGVTCIIHLAAAHRDNLSPSSIYDDVNVRGTCNVCMAAEEVGVKQIIFTSTVACYGFARPGADERGLISPFNEYGRTKFRAEQVLRDWQLRGEGDRSLVILRPTVVFGERNRGNVYNLLKQIAGGRFVMVGKGNNIKSMAYVENLAALLEYAMTFRPGLHLYNYVDKPDLDMNSLVTLVKQSLGMPIAGFRIPYWLGLAGGYFFDFLAKLSGKRFPVSAIRVRKFCATTQFSTSISNTGFVPPVPLLEGLKRTIKYEFQEKVKDEKVFFSE